MGGRFVEGRSVEGRLVGRTFCSGGRFVEGRFVLVPSPHLCHFHYPLRHVRSNQIQALPLNLFGIFDHPNHVRLLYCLYKFAILVYTS
jgi:hypothetical protein